MSDLISRSALLGAFREYMIERFDRERCSSEENCKVCDRQCLWIRKVGEAPTVDAVPVVRCKDCKRWLKDVAGCSEIVGRCEYANYMVGSNGYCVYGERKDNE
jgi:hypothetical protein